MCHSHESPKKAPKRLLPRLESRIATNPHATPHRHVRPRNAHVAEAAEAVVLRSASSCISCAIEVSKLLDWLLLTSRRTNAMHLRDKRRGPFTVIPDGCQPTRTPGCCSRSSAQCHQLLLPGGARACSCRGSAPQFRIVTDRGRNASAALLSKAHVEFSGSPLFGI